MPIELFSIRSLTSLLFQISISAQNPTSSHSQHVLSEPYSNAPSCPINGPLSCHNSTIAPDSCCFIYPGGRLVQTQFWDTSPSVGPTDSWTLHGLWPDLCDGSYSTFCNSAPTYYNITQIISNSNNQALLDEMNQYWLPNSGTREHFWEHEWNKHGTCINTLSPGCYAEGYEAGTEVVDFFERAVDIFKGLDTYAALANHSILPSSTRTYTLVQIKTALKSITGHDATIGCRGNILNQAWYSFNVKGSLQTGEFVATNPARKMGRGGCPARGIKYLPK